MAWMAYSADFEYSIIFRYVYLKLVTCSAGGKPKLVYPPYILIADNSVRIDAGENNYEGNPYGCNFFHQFPSYRIMGIFYTR